MKRWAVVSGVVLATLICGVLAAEETKTLTVIIVDADGVGIPQAKFRLNVNPIPEGWSERNKSDQTGDDGVYTFAYPANVDYMSITVKTAGYTPYNATWENPKIDPVPTEYVITLDKAMTVGGIVLDDEGKPLAGATVSFSIPWDERIRVKKDNYVCGMDEKTDENGVWKSDMIPLDMAKTTVWLTAKHLDFADLRVGSVNLEPLAPDTDGKFQYVITMKRGINVKGRVTDEAGNPVADALVVGRPEGTYGNDAVTTTDENGEYVINGNWPENVSAYVGVRLPGKMAVLKSLSTKNATSPMTVDFVLKPAGKPIKVKIVDKDQKPIPGFFVAIERWGNHRLVHRRMLTGEDQYGTTDENGCWTWYEAPEEAVTLDIMSPQDRRYMDVRNKTMIARDEEYVFVAPPALRITGKVTDEATGEVITEGSVYLGIGFAGNSRKSWQSRSAMVGSDGTYEMTTTFPYDHFAVKIEAKGYEAFISRDIQPDEGNVTIDAALKPLDPATVTVISGTVRKPDGSPAANATVALATADYRPYIQNAAIDREVSPYVVKTNAGGQFEFPYIDFAKEREQSRYGGARGAAIPDYAMIVLHESGFQQVTQKTHEDDKEQPITLEAWGRIEGIVKQGTAPLPQAGLLCDILAPEGERRSFSEPEPWYDYGTTADANGNFVFTKLPPGRVRVVKEVVFARRNGGYTSTGSHSVKLELAPGETAQVVIGGEGRPVQGKLLPPASFESAPDWNYCVVRFIPCFERPNADQNNEDNLTVQKLRETIPREIKDEADFEKREKLLEKWFAETEEGKHYKAVLDVIVKRQEELMKLERQIFDDAQGKSRACAVNADGSFLVYDIPPGRWTLEVDLSAPPPSPEMCGPGDRIGTLKQEFTIDEFPGTMMDEPLDLGELTVEPIVPRQPTLQVGDMVPDFEIPWVEPISDDDDASNDTTEANVDEPAKMFQLSDYRGKYVVLDFWATWCGPCLDKLPELKAFYEKIADDENIVLIGISLDEPNSEKMLGKFIVKHEMNWIHGLAGGWQADVVRNYGVNAIPALFVIDPEGKVTLSNPPMAVMEKFFQSLEK